MVHPSLVAREAIGINPQEPMLAEHVEADRDMTPDVGISATGRGPADKHHADRGHSDAINTGFVLRIHTRANVTANR